MANHDRWEFRFKAAAAAASLISAMGLVIGGFFALYQYHYQKQQEMRLMQYNLKKDVYYDLAVISMKVVHPD